LPKTSTPNALVLAVAVSAHAYAASLAAEVTLSHELPTPSLPAAPVVVGDSWRNRGLRLLTGQGDGIRHLHFNSVKM